MSIFYISDTHFFHRGIIKHDSAAYDGIYPFENIDQHDAALIDNWNRRVTGSDEVVILGDFAYANKEKTIALLSLLKGKKIVIMGNHDKTWYKELQKYSQTKVKSVQEYLKINDDGRTVILCHYPIFNWAAQHNGSYHVYGHVHNSVEEEMFQKAGQVLQNNRIPEFRAVNAGCMLYGFKPVTLSEMINKYKLDNSKNFQIKTENSEQLSLF